MKQELTMSYFCPKCQTLRELRIGSIEERDTGSDVKKKTIIRGYFCGTCNTFIKSEEIEVPEKTCS
jgi:hypothetical protein